MGKEKEKEKNCPICGNHCPREKLKCSRGRKYFEKLEGKNSKEEKKHKKKDGHAGKKNDKSDHKNKKKDKHEDKEKKKNKDKKKD